MPSITSFCPYYELGVFRVKTGKSLQPWLEELNRRVPCSQSAIMLMIPGDDYLELVDHRGYIVAPELHTALGHGIAGTVAETGEAEIVNEVEVDPRFVSEGHGIEQLLCVPLFNQRNQVVGVVSLSNPLESDGFTSQHKRTVQKYLRNHPVKPEQYVQPEV